MCLLLYLAGRIAKVPGKAGRISEAHPIGYLGDGSDVTLQ
jgi:hypothetical protein